MLLIYSYERANNKAVVSATRLISILGVNNDDINVHYYKVSIKYFTDQYYR